MGEQDGCQHVKEENHGYGLGNLIVIRIDYRRRGCDGGTAADGGAHTHQSGNVGWDMHELLWSTKAITREVVMVHTMMGRDCLPVSSTTFKFMPKPRRMTAHCSIFFGGEFDTVLQPVFSFHEYGYDHAGKDGDDSAANDGEHFPQKPGRDSQQQAECQSFPFLL